MSIRMVGTDMNDVETISIPEVSIDSIIKNISREVSRKTDSFSFSLKSEEDVLLVPLQFSVDRANDLCSIGKEMPPMALFPGFIRPVASLAGRGLLFLSRFITDRQHAYNTAVIGILREVVDVLNRLHSDRLQILTESRQQMEEQRLEFEAITASLKAEILRLKQTNCRSDTMDGVNNSIQ